MKPTVRYLLWSLPPFFLVFSFSVTTLVGWTLVWLLLPFGRDLVMKGEDYCYATCAWVFAFFFHKYIPTEYVFYGDDLPKHSENVILLSNHQCSVDWLILEFLTLRAKAAGYTRFILKDVLRLVPVYGFMINRHGGIFVRRRGGHDKDTIHDSLKKMADLKRPIWLCIFPEGTRYDPTKVSLMEKSKRFAESLGLAPLRHVLTPRTTGFETVMEVGRKYFTSVYDVTIMYESYDRNGNGSGSGNPHAPPNVFTFVGGCCKRVHIHIHKTSVEDLPEESEELRQWLYQRYSEKDRFLDALHQMVESPEKKSEIPTPTSTVPPMSGLRLNLAFLLGLACFIFHVFHSYGPLLWVTMVVSYSVLGIVIAFFPLPF